MNPFAYDDYRKQKVQEKMQGKAEQRIALKTPLPKVPPHPPTQQPTHPPTGHLHPALTDVSMLPLSSLRL